MRFVARPIETTAFTWKNQGALRCRMDEKGGLLFTQGSRFRFIRYIDEKNHPKLALEEKNLAKLILRKVDMYSRGVTKIGEMNNLVSLRHDSKLFKGYLTENRFSLEVVMRDMILERRRGKIRTLEELLTLPSTISNPHRKDSIQKDLKILYKRNNRLLDQQVSYLDSCGEQGFQRKIEEHVNEKEKNCIRTSEFLYDVDLS